MGLRGPDLSPGALGSGLSEDASWHGIESQPPHTRHLSPNLCLMPLPDSSPESPLLQLGLGTCAIVPYWTEMGFELEFLHLLMTSWVCQLLTFPIFSPTVSCAIATPRIKLLLAQHSPLVFPSVFKVRPLTHSLRLLFPP